MAISISNIGQTSFTVNWTTHSGSVGNYNIEVYNYDTGSLIKSAYNIGSTIRSYGITALTKCTRYEVKLYSKTTGGATNVVEYAYPWTACPTPGSVGSLSIDSATTSAIQFDWSSATDAYDYNIEVYVGSSPSGTLAYSAYNISTTYRNCTGLSSGTTYTAKVWAENAVGDNGSTSTLTSETVCSAPSWTDYYGASTSSVYLDWGGVTGADEYQIYNVTTGSTVTVTSSYYTWTGLSSGTSYTFQVRANNTWYGAYGSQISVSTLASPPATPTNFRVTSYNTDGFNVAWNSVSGATEYRVEAWHSADGTVKAQNYYLTGTSTQITGLNQYVSYDLKLWAINSGGSSSPTWLYGETTKDGTAPTVTITSTDGTGSVYFAWNASDAHSGIRATNKFAVYIGTPDGAESTLAFKAYTDDYFYSFTSDANGATLTNNATYWVKVIAYDAYGNTSTASTTITYTRTRPNSWSWHVPKVQGDLVEGNLTAAEWNSFSTRINEFRQYQFLSNYTFTNVGVGTYLTESIFNEKRLAISAMSPPTAVNPLYKEGGVWILRAQDINNLRDALNSIP